MCRLSFLACYCSIIIHAQAAFDGYLLGSKQSPEAGEFSLTSSTTFLFVPTVLFVLSSSFLISCQNYFPLHPSVAVFITRLPSLPLSFKIGSI
ncbi:hypothetical protein L249_7762 [Ophiocordyceps polyrhachis-furcata BCC 54312]|uniref:Uncharacterized protein n=1 Tax=Ophiocordyceps polyrhachis-furcata BCC 54312 TaxID=1330021 RepID=A0A367L9Y4_9HYPO|nr:hypothetical protein L249_7762 [Ophiocordyceps polyrhachis-furcata BCC 54312]